jgi:SAM-dependent methyltransferase
MKTDLAWEEWGKRDPYFAVITDPRYRRTAFDDGARKEFFATGQGHVDYLLATIKKNFDLPFAPHSVVEYGCGVGRLLVPFASIAGDVVGLDVSDAMLQEARRNCDLHNLRNVRLIKSDDQLSGLTGKFDLLHSCIVFQHIPPDRGQVILSRLLQFLRPGGIAAVQLLFCNSTPTSELDASAAGPEQGEPSPPVPAPNLDPEIQMNPYDLNRVFLTLQRAGIPNFYADFTDHGGELGVFLFFRLPEQ